MTSIESLGGEQFDQNRVITPFDRRHPTQENFDYLLRRDLDQMKLTEQYTLARTAIDNFFKDGKRVPPGEDESY